MTDPLRIVANRPGLSAIAYRIATHAQFKRDLLARIAGDPALRGLTTRSDDDFAIAMLDAWACAADVVTFYQERLANESYLRTASERESLAQLARLLGYELGPGVAASTALAFTVDAITTRGRPVEITAGTRIQSIPGPGEQPQSFETDAPLLARAAHNELRAARAGRPLAEPIVDLSAPDTLVIRSVVDDLVLDRRGDVALATALRGDPGAGQQWRLADVDGPGEAQTFAIRSGADDSVLTYIGRGLPLALRPRDPARPPAQRWRSEFVDGERLALRNAAESETLELYRIDGELRAVPLSALVGPHDHQLWTITAADWHARLFTRSRVSAGDVVLAVPLADPSRARIATIVTLTARPDLDASEVVLARWSAPATAGRERLIVLRRRAALFGHNAPDPNTLDFAATELFDNKIPNRTWAGFAVSDGPLELDSSYPDLRVGDPVVVREGARAHIATISAVDAVTRAAFALNSRVSRLTLRDGHGAALTGFDRRAAEVHLAPEPLLLLAPPREDPVAGAIVELEGTLPDLAEGRQILLSGPRSAGAPAIELATLAHVEPRADGTTAITLTAPLQHAYRREAVLVRANVVAASHGERVREVLGSGDSSLPLQRFALKQAPLTFVAGGGGLGRVSTLQVEVDGERWREVLDFESAGPRDRVYTVALNEGGGATIQFGDGRRGARPPTGAGNIVASYRRGIGLAGQVGADRLALLATPTLGVTAVTNPLPASGAAPPEDLADARRNAPLPVRTLGRVVSLRDYEDYARAFTGVARAHAARFQDGPHPVVLLTIAGHDNAPIAPAGATATALIAALRAAGDPFVRVRLHTHDPAASPPPTFTIGGRVTVAPERDPDAVKLAIAAALQSRFGFAGGDFARPVHRSAVIAAIQAVPGVLAVDLTRFTRTGEDEPAVPLARLLPRIARGFASDSPPTELLTLDSAASASLEVTR